MTISMDYKAPIYPAKPLQPDLFNPLQKPWFQQSDSFRDAVGVGKFLSEAVLPRGPEPMCLEQGHAYKKMLDELKASAKSAK